MSSVYASISKNSINPWISNDTTNFKNIWRANIPNKIKKILWLLQHKRLKTNFRMYSLGLPVPPNCPIYGYSAEEINHLFFQSTIAKDFWDDLLQK